MLKQTVAVRSHRDKGVKVKHVLQVFILLGICMWLLNQIRHSYNDKQVYINGNGSESENVGVKLGRKDLNPKVENEEEEVEEIKPEEGDDEGRGGGDDEVDGHDQEKTEEEETEEVQDIVDEEDREKENQIEDLSLVDGQLENEGEEEDSQEAREENYKGDDASGAVLQKST